MLYIGYVGFAVPFAFAVAALLEGRWTRPGGAGCGHGPGRLVRADRRYRAWILVVLLRAGLGRVLVLGPVENASLLPWLTGTALLHSALVVEKREALKTGTVLLAIGTFSLTLSGNLPGAIGHPEFGAFLRQRPDARRVHPGLLAFVIGGSLLLFALRAPALSNAGIFAPLSREGALVLNNILLCSIAAV